MVSFDITSILDFQPPKLMCPACRGLFASVAADHSAGWDKAVYSCPVCKVQFITDEWPQNASIHDFLRQEGYVMDQRDLFPHATALAQLVRRSKKTQHEEAWPTMRLFFEALARARHFVHFTSWGMSHVMIGALKVTSMRVPVYGFVSDLPAAARVELTEYPTEAPKLNAKAIPTKEAIYDAPHQKIIIVDGLLAFKGSTNLTQAGMRRADRGLDVSEVVTDFQQVTELNNKYFAPVWRRISNPSDTYVCYVAPF